MREFSIFYPNFRDFINSTSAARVNGYVGGYGTPEALREDLSSLGLSETAGKRLLQIVAAKTRGQESIAR